MGGRGLGNLAPLVSYGAGLSTSHVPSLLLRRCFLSICKYSKNNSVGRENDLFHRVYVMGREKEVSGGAGGCPESCAR